MMEESIYVLLFSFISDYFRNYVKASMFIDISVCLLLSKLMVMVCVVGEELAVVPHK